MGITVQSMFLNKFKKLTRQLDFFVFIMYLFTDLVVISLHTTNVLSMALGGA